MPVSGNEETGVKPVAWQSSNYSAGIPIKKRRFPMPPSPPSEEPSSLPAENDSLQKELSNPFRGSTLSNVSVAESSSGLPDANNSAPDERKGEFDASNVNLVQSDDRNSNATNVNLMPSNVRPSGIKLEGSSLASHSSSLADVDTKKNLMTSVSINSVKTELKLAPSEEMQSQQKVGGQHVLERSTISGSTKLSLGMKGHLMSALAGQSGEGPSQNQENVEAVCLNLSLSKEDCSTRCKSDKVESNIDRGSTHANRCNWDLNTTMDAWEGPENDSGAGEATISGLKTVSETNDLKPSIIASGIVGTSVASGKQILGESECRANYIESTIPYALPINYEDSLRFCLSSSIFQSHICQQPSSSSAKVDANAFFANSSLSKVLVQTSNLNIVKSEPLDESVKHDSNGPRGNSMGLLDFIEVKRELSERCNIEVNKSPNVNVTLAKLVDDPKSIKTEPVNESNQETVKKIQDMSNLSDRQVLQHVKTGVLSKSGGSSKLVERPVSTEANHSTAEVPLEARGQTLPVASEMVPVGQDGNKINILSLKDIPIAEDKSIAETEHCRSKFMNELSRDSQENAEGSVSDEEKINLSGDMLEEDPYGSEYESDGNQDLTLGLDREKDGRGEDDFEDGEVRELQEHSAVQGPVCEKREVEHVSQGDLDCKNTRLPGDGHHTSFHVAEKDPKQDLGEKRNNDIKECADMVQDEKTIELSDKDNCLQESSSVEIPSGECEQNKSVKVIQRESIDASERKDAPEVQEMEESSEHATSGSQGISIATAQGSDLNINQAGAEEKNDSGLPKTEASLHGDDTAKDVSNGGNRSRIINLSRASNISSPGKTRSISDRSLLSRVVRERFPDVALEGDKLRHRVRGEIYNDSSYKFSRERHQDYSSRNPRLNIGRGRGRVSSRIDPLHGDWNSELDMAPDFYNGPAEPCVPRHKFASGVVGADLEFDGYDIGPNSGFVGTGPAGRKLINDNAPIFHHLPSARRSPGVRDGPIPRGLQMAHRIPRNIGEENSELGGLRPNDKYIRGFPDDNANPAFARSRPQFEGLDGHFVRGNRNFPSVQRRGLPQVRSKSPIRSRTRSPGPRASPRRRSTDGFGGHPELPRRRSPQIYRMERMRSPDHPCFPGEVVVRRHGSPSFMSRPTNDLRDLDSGWEHGHPRSVIPNRSPTGQVLLRNGRRFDIANPRERADGNEFFPGSINSSRFHEFGGDGNGEERRRFGDRRGPIRHFRRPYNGADGDHFCLNVGDGPRPFRFGPGDGTEFHDRGPLRDNREFDRRIKNRPGNVHRRTRPIEEQERNFRHGAQVWHEDGFDDISRLKRKRF